MKKVVLYIAMSMDGYIADISGGVSWLGGDGSEAEFTGTYEAFMETVDTVIMGYTTYNQLVTELSPDYWPYEGKQSYIITSRELPNRDNVNFTKDIDDLIKSLRNKDGKNIWICGGASIAKEFLNRGEVDRIQLNLIPQILGDGIRLFENGIKPHGLIFVETINYNGIVDIIYDVKKSN